MAGLYCVWVFILIKWFQKIKRWKDVIMKITVSYHSVWTKREARRFISQSWSGSNLPLGPATPPREGSVLSPPRPGGRFWTRLERGMRIHRGRRGNRRLPGLAGAWGFGGNEICPWVETRAPTPSGLWPWDSLWSYQKMSFSIEREKYDNFVGRPTYK